jgi:hypothetical protein
VAVVVSIARGHDASYPFKTIGAADGATITGGRGAGYYLSAVEKGGEPAGTWIGNGAATLGFHDGDTLRRESGTQSGRLPPVQRRGRASSGVPPS